MSERWQLLPSLNSCNADNCELFNCMHLSCIWMYACMYTRVEVRILFRSHLSPSTMWPQGSNSDWSSILMTESLYLLSRCPSIHCLFSHRTSPLPSPDSLVQSLSFRVQLSRFQSRLDIHHDCLEPLFPPLLICRRWWGQLCHHQW